jgi:hypothetical protein
MSLIGISGAMGVTSESLNELLNGRVTPGVGGRLGATSGSLQEFLVGGTSIGLAGHIGCTSTTLQDLRNLIGDEGAIGLLIGLCIGVGKERA